MVRRAASTGGVSQNEAAGDSPARSRGLEAVRAWFAGRGWTPWPFQVEAWSAYLAGESGLIHVPTGAGKTYAAYMGPLAELVEEAEGNGGPSDGTVDGVRVVLVTPLRAVSRDTALALEAPLREMGLLREAGARGKRASGVTVETRTGDTSSSVRAKQRERLPNVLVTTPESLTLLLTQAESAERFAGLRCVIVDEWHELLSTKRGTQVELALARLRRWAPGMRAWAMSATLSNLEEAASAVVGVGRGFRIVSARMEREVVIESVLPKEGDVFPWAGHLGLSMLPRVVERLETDDAGGVIEEPGELPPTLVFVNTRSQAERWFHALQATRPEWFGVLGLHHGSIDRAERERVEAGLKSGSVRVVVATSSLDLGVDFAPVERVVQIGSPKGIARLMQRAGRASHRPGAACRVWCVPTHALEMLEIAAVRRAIELGAMEPRGSERKPLDVLSQHMVSVALGGGFVAEELFEEVRGAWSFRELTREEFDWTLALVRDGGSMLGAYPEYRRVVADAAGVYRVPDERLGQAHRLNVGTIVSDATMEVRYASGGRLGSIEEGFIDRLRAGEKFVFAGKVVEFVRSRDQTAIVRPARGRTSLTPIWGGTRLPITEALGGQVREVLEGARDGRIDGPEVRAAGRLIAAQMRLSEVPDAGRTLCEITRTRDGQHLFVYPFEGRLVHGGLGALLAFRLSRRVPATFTISANDYGVELLTDKDVPLVELMSGESGRELLSVGGLMEDARASVNLSALARSQFREVARVAGLVMQSFPGGRRAGGQGQARAGLIFDVFEQFDPGNLLLEQARREVMEKQFERSRLGRTLERLSGAGALVVREVARPTPLALPLVVERIGARLSSESVLERVERMKRSWGER